MKLKEILSKVDHTQLSQAATLKDIKGLIDDAAAYGAATVCIPAAYLKEAAAYLRETGKAVPLCVCVGFPNGYDTTAAKVFEAKEAIENGASEVDMVIHVGRLKDGRDEDVLEEIRAVKAACGDHVLKVIIETCLLTEEEKIRMCGVVTRSGADFIKTSTGFSAGGATFEDVELFARHVGKNVRIKAAGGIRSLEDAKRFVELGADRLGTSRVIRLVKEKGLDPDDEI